MFRSSRRTFSTIAVAYFAVGIVMTLAIPICGWFTMLGALGWGNREYWDKGERLAQKTGVMTYPIDALVPSADQWPPLVALTLATVFWASIVTVAVWCLRTLRRRLKHR